MSVVIQSEELNDKLSLWNLFNLCPARGRLMLCVRVTFKPQPNVRNIQRNIVERNMLRTLDHPVCYDMLGVVGSNLKIVKFFTQHFWMLHAVVVVWPVLRVSHSGPVHTTEATPEVFTLKAHQMFFLRTVPEMYKRNNHRSFWICVQGKLGQGNDVIIMMSSSS